MENKEENNTPEERKVSTRALYEQIQKEMEQYKKEHPIRWWFDSVKFELYCYIFNNKLMQWFKYKILKLD